MTGPLVPRLVSIDEADTVFASMMRHASQLARLKEELGERAWAELDTVTVDGLLLATEVLAIAEYLTTEGWMPSHWAPAVNAHRRTP